MVGAVGTRAGVEQHVRRLHVAMDEAPRVGRIEGARHLGEDSDRVRGVEPSVSETLLEVASLDVAHCDEEEIVGLAGLVDRDDVRMVDRRGELRLAEEAVAERLVLGQAGGSNFSATFRLSRKSSAR